MQRADQLANQLASQTAVEPATPTKKSWRRYLLWAAVIPLAAWLAAFPLVCSKGYENWGETQYGPVLEFPYQAGSPDADVVIFGDSSAFLGIDPLQVNRELGLRSVVLPSTVGSLPVIGDTPLRVYLAHHPQPKLIVLYFSPWNLDFSHTAPGRLFEGEEMMLRHGSWRETLRFQARHPLELPAFPLRLYSTFGPKMMLQMLHGQSRERDTAAGLGHVPYLEPYGPLNDLCRVPSAYLAQQSDATVAALRKRYLRPGTDVMVYLAPVPRCQNDGVLDNRSYGDLGAAAPVLLPAPEFAADPYYAHVLPAFVPVASHRLAGAIRQRLEQTAPATLEGAAERSDDRAPALRER